MKKLAILLLGILPLVLNSCLKEQEDFFPDDASVRAEKFAQKTIEVLEGAENGWHVKYYPNPDQTFGGFHLFFKFKDGQVTVASEMDDAAKTATSLYSLSKEAGVTLTIDTKNELINYFVHPRNPDGMGSNYKGLEGDYLWTVMKAEADEVILHGVKSGNTYTLTPLKTSDWASEMREYQQLPNTMKLSSHLLVVKQDTLEVITTKSGNFLHRNLSIRHNTPEGLETYSAPFIYTKTGIEFYKTMEINGVKFQTLNWEREGLDKRFVNEERTVIYTQVPVAKSNIQLAYSGIQTTITTAKFTVTPTIATDAYWVGLFDAAETGSMSDEDLIDALNPQMAGQALNKGTKTLTITKLEEETEYEIIGFGVDEKSKGISTDKVFRQKLTTPSSSSMSFEQGFKDWFGTWEVTSTSSETSGTSYTFTITIRPESTSRYLIRGWGYTTFSRDYEIIAPYISANKGFGLRGLNSTLNNVATTAEGGVISFFARFYYTDTTPWTKGGLVTTGESSNALTATPNGANAGKVDGGSWTINGRPSTMTSLDFWHILDGSNYYITSILPGFVYQDFFIGPYTMKRVSTSYKTPKVRSNSGKLHNYYQPIVEVESATESVPAQHAE